jgi:hypothetical protein
VGSDDSKTPNERAALDRLLNATASGVDRGSIRKWLGESLPDFHCLDANGSEVAFEVTEICSEELAHLIALAKSGQSDFTYTSDPTEAILRDKLRKSYATQVPIELVCYWGGRTVSTDDMIIPTIEATLADARVNPFRAVWYVGEKVVRGFRNAS